MNGAMQIDLNDMALFVEVAKARSFRGAAKSIGVPNSTISRRIAVLEKSVGVRLLHRTTRRIELTEAGILYYERCKRIVDEARLAHEQLGDMVAQPSGVLRVSLPVGFATVYLAPVICEFAERYPDIAFELDLTPRRADLIADPVDVAIRMGDSPDSALIARLIARPPRHLYASPDYLDLRGEPAVPTDLTKHQCLRMKGVDVETWSLQADGQTVAVPISGRYLLNDATMIHRLATLGQGIAILGESVAAEDVARGRLKRVLPQWSARPVPAYAVTDTRLLPAKVQLFIDFLRARLHCE